jgi:hypothetical protein
LTPALLPAGPTITDRIAWISQQILRVVGISEVVIAVVGELSAQGLAEGQSASGSSSGSTGSAAGELAG